jgi:tellurite resistance protein TehA-like permease
MSRYVFQFFQSLNTDSLQRRAFIGLADSHRISADTLVQWVRFRARDLVGGGMPDIFAYALIGYALLQALILIRLLPWLVQAELMPAWWSFSFGAASQPTAAMKLVAHRDDGAIAALAPYLFIAGNIVIAAIATVPIKWVFNIARRNPS